MNVSLTPELEALIAAQVKSGRYSTASEYVREALRYHEKVMEKTSAGFREARATAGIPDA